MEMVKSDVVKPDVAKLEEPVLGSDVEQAKNEIKQEVEDSRLVDLAAFQFNLIEDQITRADTKAGLVVAALVVIAALIGGGLFLRSRHSTALTEKDTVVLADFVNTTGDPVFDTTLNQALQIDLEQSPVLNIVSQQHLLQSVKYLGKPEGTPVTPAIAREIGEREGIKAIITGTIANLGKQYVITLTAQNTATGDEIVSDLALGGIPQDGLGGGNGGVAHRQGVAAV